MLLIGKWFKDNLFLLIIAALGTGLIVAAVHSYIGQVEKLAVAQQNLQLQTKAIGDLKEEFGKFKTSTETTLASMATMRAEMDRIDKAAKQRNADINKKLEQIKNDPTKTDAEKEQEISVTYAQSLQSTYCLYVPTKCAKKEGASAPAPADATEVSEPEKK